jgi:hypothetical protein
MPPNVPSFAELLREARTSAVHLEMRDVYGISDEAADFEAWRAGRRVDWDNRDEWWHDFYAEVQRAVARGVRMRRARVVSEPVTDYTSGDVWKTRLFIYSEDFGEFFKLLQATAVFIRANPVPDEVKKKRTRFWAKKAAESATQPKTDPNGPTSPQPAPAR